MLATGIGRITLISLSLGLLGLIAGCNPRELMISATDRVYVPSPKEVAEQESKKASEAKTEPPGERARPDTETVTSPSPAEAEKAAGAAGAAGGAAALEEVLVAEPPIESPREPQPPERPPGSPSNEALPAAPLVAQAGSGDDAGSSAAPALAGGASGPPLEDVLFDYDRFLIRQDAKAILQANAATLRESKRKVLIEGHTDERGTSEYNLVLGEKRARAARQYLQDLGIEASRMEITSLGKEKPFCTEHNPTCWQKNRRAHFSMQ